MMACWPTRDAAGISAPCLQPPLTRLCGCGTWPQECECKAWQLVLTQVLSSQAHVSAATIRPLPLMLSAMNGCFLCRCLSVSKPHGGTVRCLALDSALLASGCSDHVIRVWLPVGGKARGLGDGCRRSSTGTGSECGSSSSGGVTGTDTDGQPVVDPLSLVDDTIAPVVAAPPTPAGASSCAACIFDLSQPPAHMLSGHRGPVDALCLSEHALYSGSWDYR